MAGRFGDKLVGAATAPLQEARSLFEAGKVVDAIEALDEGRLRAAFRHGVSESARLAGVRAERVQALLPRDDLEPALIEAGAAQRELLETWNRHAARVSGFLSGVGLVSLMPPSTQAPAAAPMVPDVAENLSHLAINVARDHQLASPLVVLAEAMRSWQALLRRCAEALEASRILETAYRRKLAIRAALLLALAAVIVTVSSWRVALNASRERVGDALTNADPCAAREIASTDLERATEQQLKQRADRLAACEAERTRAEKEAAERKAAADRNARCRALGESVEAGRLSPDQIGPLGNKGALLRRIAEGSLTAADLKLDDAALNVGCPDQEAMLWRSLARSAAKTPGAWSGAERISGKLQQTLATNSIALTADSERALSVRAEVLAQRSLVMGDGAKMTIANSLCELHATVGIPQGGWCAALGKALARRARR